MPKTGYSIETGCKKSWEDSHQYDITAYLGCEHTTVGRYHTENGRSIKLPPGQEVVLITIEGSGEVSGVGKIPETGLVSVPARVNARISSEDSTEWIVVSTSVDPTKSASPALLDLSDVRFTPSVTSGIQTAHLTTRLNIAGMKVNARILHPDEAIPYHTEGSQEELFVPFDGPGSMVIDGERHEIPKGGIIRVDPDIPRAAINDTDVERLWVMIGAPPTGPTDGWDPGARTLEFPPN